MAAPLVEEVRLVAEPAVLRAGLIVEEVTITAAGRRRLLRITVDLPDDALGGVAMDAVSQASHEVSAVLDASAVMGAQPYVLEVSSPGVDRPLTQRRHWLRARNRLVEVKPAQGGGPDRHLGRLSRVDDDGITIDDQILTWSQISGGRVQVEFGDPGGPDRAED